MGKRGKTAIPLAPGTPEGSSYDKTREVKFLTNTYGSVIALNNEVDSLPNHANPG